MLQSQTSLSARRGDPAAAGAGGDPVADRAAVSDLDRAEELSGRRVEDPERARLARRPHRVAAFEPGLGIRSGVRLRDERDEPGDLVVVQCVDERIEVGRCIGPQQEVAVAELHGLILERRKAACGGLSEDNPAATYSPGRLPSEYHRRWRA